MRETVPGEELDKAYSTIATLTAMLDRELSIIDGLSEGEVRVTREEVVAGKAEVRDEVPKAPLRQEVIERCQYNGQRNRRSQHGQHVFRTVPEGPLEAVEELLDGLCRHAVPDGLVRTAAAAIQLDGLDRPVPACWLPRPLRNMAPRATHPRGWAIPRAATTRPAPMLSRMLQPTALRVHRSMATARQMKPPVVLRLVKPDFRL